MTTEPTDLAKLAANALEPCPFCGGEGKTFHDHGTFYAACLEIDCHCCVGESYDRDAMPDHAFRKDEEAAAAWNHRDTAPAIPTEAGQGFSGGVTIEALQSAHVARQDEWCPDQKPDLSFRGNEMAGEVGEACNVIKKLERERLGWRGSRASIDDLGDELADVIHTAILCAITAGIPLEQKVVSKFNATSEKNGLSVFLSAIDIPAPAGGEEAVADVSTMKLSDGREDHYVMLRCEDRSMSIRVYPQKGRAEYEAAELNWLLSGGEKPCVRDFDTDTISGAQPLYAQAHPAPDHHLQAEVERLRAKNDSPAAEGEAVAWRFRTGSNYAWQLRHYPLPKLYRDEVQEPLYAHPAETRIAALEAAGPMWGRWFKHDEAPAGSYPCLYKAGEQPVALAWMPAQGRPVMPDTVIMPFHMPNAARSALANDKTGEAGS